MKCVEPTERRMELYTPVDIQYQKTGALCSLHMVSAANIIDAHFAALIAICLPS